MVLVAAVLGTSQVYTSVCGSCVVECQEGAYTSKTCTYK